MSREETIIQYVKQRPGRTARQLTEAWPRDYHPMPLGTMQNTLKRLTDRGALKREWLRNEGYAYWATDPLPRPGKTALWCTLVKIGAIRRALPRLSGRKYRKARVALAHHKHELRLLMAPFDASWLLR